MRHNDNSTTPVALASTVPLSFPTRPPAPDIAVGDHVLYKSRPAGLEKVTLVEWSAHGGGGWYVHTQRGSDLYRMTRCARAEDFRLVEGSRADPVRPGQRLAPQRPLWPVQLAVVATLIAWAALWATAGGLAR